MASETIVTQPPPGEQVAPTPGPWEVAGATYQHSFTCWTHPIHTAVPAVGQRAAGRTKTEAEANARLIAAAPDFLSACQGPTLDNTDLELASAFLTEIDGDNGCLGEFIQRRNAEEPGTGSDISSGFAAACRLILAFRLACEKAGVKL